MSAPPGDDQERSFWNSWNISVRDVAPGAVSEDQSAVILSWLEGAQGLRILDAGCGTGWMTARLVRFGQVVGVDLADEVVERARARVPAAEFIAGDIMVIDLHGPFDVVVTLEVLSHVPDQEAFLRRMADCLRPGGRLMLATQNQPVLQHFNHIAPPGPGQRRYWVSRRELRGLLRRAGFHVETMRTLSPRADHGPMRYVAKAGRVLHFTGALERVGFGWTIVVRAVGPM